ncbi:hypothetical protein BJV74DRAFT_113240 [Russula compacta]|nr:hypothetical protein BJV74DRAFT_113240 [Russula compacta]
MSRLWVCVYVWASGGRQRPPGPSEVGSRHVPASSGAARRMIVSLSPVPIALSISSVFWTALLSLLIALFILFFNKFTMVRAEFALLFPIIIPAHFRHLRQSRSSRKDVDVREFVRATGATYAPLFQPPYSTCIRTENNQLLAHGRQSGILISISVWISPSNHT